MASRPSTISPWPSRTQRKDNRRNAIQHTKQLSKSVVVFCPRNPQTFGRKSQKETVETLKKRTCCPLRKKIGDDQNGYQNKFQLLAISGISLREHPHPPHSFHLSDLRKGRVMEIMKFFSQHFHRRPAHTYRYERGTAFAECIICSVSFSPALSLAKGFKTVFCFDFLPLPSRVPYFHLFRNSPWPPFPPPSSFPPSQPTLSPSWLSAKKATEINLKGRRRRGETGRGKREGKVANQSASV